jgi:repressor LexA
LTSTRLKILFWVHRYCDEKGYSPTLREMCVAFRWSSPNAAQEYCDSLVAVGLIRREPGLSRTLRVTNAGMAVLKSLAPEAIASHNSA